MNIVDFFKGIGHLLARAFGLIRRLVPEEQLRRGIELVREAADKFADNADRRAWVSLELQTVFHLPESVANLIVEIALQHVKADLIDAGAARLQGEGDTQG